MTPAAENLPLRDIHLPDPVGWWPPAPGWWGLALLCLVLAAALWAALKAGRRGVLRKHSLALLRQLSEHSREGGDQQLVAQLSVLLRRVALSSYPRREVAALTGEEWLRFLDSSLTPNGSEKAFSEGVGRALIEAPYNPACRVDTTALVSLVRRWIVRNAMARRR